MCRLCVGGMLIWESMCVSDYVSGGYVCGGLWVWLCKFAGMCV